MRKPGRPRWPRVGPSPEQIREARMMADLTQKRLAERLGVTVWRVIHWEAGKAYPRQSEIAAMRRFLTFREVAVAQ